MTGELHCAPQSESRLLSLPAELRNQISRLSLVQHHPVKVSRELVFDNTGILDHELGYITAEQFPSLTQTCRQLRAETRAMYFEENAFCFTGDVFDKAFLSAFELFCGPYASTIESIKVEENFTATLEDDFRPHFCTASYEVRWLGAGRVGLEETRVRSGPQTRACACRIRWVLSSWHYWLNHKDKGRLGDPDSLLGFLRYVAELIEGS